MKAERCCENLRSNEIAEILELKKKNYLTPRKDGDLNKKGDINMENNITLSDVIITLTIGLIGFYTFYWLIVELILLLGE